MDRYILTGAPGAGKTAVLRMLELGGATVVEEAATDVIAVSHALGQAEPWQDRAFIDRIVSLQRRRQTAARPTGTGALFFDRSPVCTLALSHWLGRAPTRLLTEEIDRLLRDNVYEKAVFFVRNLGRIEATSARRINFDDALRFERVHEQTYRDLGFQLVDLPPAPLEDRVAQVQEAVGRLRAGRQRT